MPIGDLPFQPGFLHMKELSFEEYYNELKQGLSERLLYLPLRTAPEIANEIISAVLLDCPFLFWFEGQWRVVRNHNAYAIAPDYTFSADDLPAAKAQIWEVFDRLSDITEVTEAGIARELYRRLIRTVRYSADSSSFGQTIYHALVGKKALCKGLAKSYQLLLGSYGIASAPASGFLNETSRHVWNVVRIDGHFYNVDLCMGYPELAPVFGPDAVRLCESEHGIFLSDKQLARTHRLPADSPYRIQCL